MQPVCSPLVARLHHACKCITLESYTWSVWSFPDCTTKRLHTNSP